LELDNEDPTTEEICLLGSSKQITKSYLKYTWLADSGASSHMTNSDDGMFNIHMQESTVTIGNGTSLKVTKIGDLKVTFRNEEGLQIFTLQKVKYIPDLCVKLLSIPVALKEGFQIGNKGLHLYLQKGKFLLLFDTLFQTKSSAICGIQLEPWTPEYANPALEQGSKIKLQEAHEKLGHCGKDSTRATAKYYGWIVSGPFRPCESCGIGKAKHAPVNKTLTPKSTIPGERWFIDISSIKHESFGGTKFWFGMLDDCTDLFVSHGLRQKSQLGDKLVFTLQTFKTKHNITPKYIRCDDAGENRKAEEKCIKAGLNIQFEYTPPGTPQRNGRIERKFATYYGRIRACYKAAGIEENILKYGVWVECARTIVKMDNIITSSTRPHSPHFQFFKKHPPIIKNLKAFGIWEL